MLISRITVLNASAKSSSWSSNPFRRATQGLKYTTSFVLGGFGHDTSSRCPVESHASGSERFSGPVHATQI